MSRRYWIALAAIGLTFIWSPLGDGQEAPQDPPAEPAGRQEQAATQPAVESEAANAEVRPAETTGPEHYERPAPNGDEQTQQSQRAPLSMGFLGDGWAQWAMAFFSLIALFISAWAVWLLWETLKATRVAVSEARSATSAAQDAVEATIEHGQRQLRPYLSVRPLKTVFREIGGGVPIAQEFELVISIEAHNTGQTPAFNKRLRGNFRVVKRDEVGSIKIKMPPLMDFGPPAMLAPNQRTELDSLSKPIKVTQGMLDGTSQILVYGQVVYESDFACYYSNFCHISKDLSRAIKEAQVNFTADNKDAPMKPVGFATLTFGNDAI